MSKTVYRDPCENQELSRLEKSRLKAESVDLAERYREAGDERKSERCEKCGTFLTFKVYEHILTEE